MRARGVNGKVEFIAPRCAPCAVSPFILKLRGVSCDFARIRRVPFAFGKPITFMDRSGSRVGLRGHDVRPADDAEGLSLWEYLLRRRERCRELLRTRA